ncbi:MAG: hypothetical protein Q9190_006010 [Brigantiaea leucoxantha]
MESRSESNTPGSRKAHRGILPSLAEMSIAQSVRGQLLDPKNMLDDYEKKKFIPITTVMNSVTVEVIEKILGDQNDQDNSAIEESRILFAVLLLANLESHYTNLVTKGIRDDALFHEDSFKAACQSTQLSDDQKDGFRLCRNKVGAELYPARRQNLSKGTILPWLRRTREDNGSYGTIYKVEPSSGHMKGTSEKIEYAEKLIRSSDHGVGKPEEWDRFCHEVVTLEKRQHSNIVPLVTSYFLQGEESTTDIKTLHLIFPWADMDLKTWMEHPPVQNSVEKERLRQGLYHQIYALVSGLSYLHRELDGEITSHHDVKPRNILVFGREFKLADFGNSRLRPSALGSDTERDPLGTYEYEPPEYRDENGLKADRPHGRAFDAWAIGCVIIELAIVIVYGWEPQKIRQFRNARLKNPSMKRPKLRENDDSFHNNPAIVGEWVKNTKDDGGGPCTPITSLLDVAKGLMVEDPRSRLYTWEAELDLYSIYDVYAERPRKVAQNANCIQPPPPKIPNGISTPLHRAAQRKDSYRVKELLERNWPLFVQDPAGLTPADIINQNAHEMDKRCLEPYRSYFGESKFTSSIIDAKDTFFNCLRRNDIKQVENLLKSNSDLAMADDEGRPTTYWVTVKGSTEMLELVLRFAEKEQLRRRDGKTQWTSLQAAASKGYTDKIEILLKRLLRSTSSLHIHESYTPDVDDQTPDGKTALFLAAECGQEAAVEKLLAHNAQIMTQCKLGNTPIHAVASAEDINRKEDLLAKLLTLEEAARCLEHKNRLGETPVALALSHQNFGCFRELQEQGADLHTVNNKGENLLHIMARTGHLAVIESYINRFEQAELSARNHMGATPLTVAKSSHIPRILAVLESQRLSPTNRDDHRVFEQPNFYTLGSDVPWLSWNHRNGYWEHLTYDSFVAYEAIYDRLRRGVTGLVQCMLQLSLLRG